MAEEAVQYAQHTDASSLSVNKRKYDDEAPPPPSGGPRRPTGFSAPIQPDYGLDGGSPANDPIQLAKQRAQEIAARLLNDAEAKRPRVDNGGSGFDSGPTDVGLNPPMSNMAPSSLPYSYGGQVQGTIKYIEIPNNRVGVIIGKSGETIKSLQDQSGAKIQVTRDVDADLSSPSRTVEISGTPDQIARAEQMIQDVISEAEAAGSGTFSRRLTGQQSGNEQTYAMKVPNNRVGLVIGKGGETIKNMQARSGARIQVIPLHLPPGDMSKERTVQIDGTSEQIEAAKQLINDVIESRNRNTSTGGGYSQQGSYQAQAPPSWVPPGQTTQQTGYGYNMQQPQYTAQAQYSGYPQTAAQGGYATTGWDQTTGAPNQQTAQGGGYYGQQPQQQQQLSGVSSASADYNGYGYGYSGYPTAVSHTGYGQTPQNPYDQQQQGGYNSAAYGGVQGDPNQAPPSAMGQQGYMTQTGYGVPTSQVGGYGTQPTPGYGPPQAQQSPSSQGGYSQPPPYGAPPVAQSGYGQQPPVYNSSYGGGGYSQPPPYSADGNAAPNPQAVQPSPVPKASPPS